MLRELFEAIGKQAVTSSVPNILKPDAEPDHVYLLPGKEDGEWIRKRAEPPPRNHVAADLSAVVEFAHTHADSACVWYSRNKVVCLIDSTDRRDLVTLPLTFSEPLKNLLGIHSKKFDQRGIILFLRTIMKECLGRSDDLIATLRRVKFENGAAVDSAVSHGKASLGKEVRSEVIGTKVLPEYVTFIVPVFESGFPLLRFPVECAFEPDPVNGTFQLLPIPGQIEQAISLAESAIGNQLADELAESEVPVYFGVP